MKRQNWKLLFLLAAAFMGMSAAARVANNPRKILFNKEWKFSLQSADGKLSSPVNITLPHDWAVKGDFSINNPSGTGGGALPGGIGWYEKQFFVDKTDKGKSFSITFDGAYMNTTVWVNGKLLGNRPYGYISFSYDITPYLKYGKQNVVKVKVDNSDQPNSRWYSGCGIYRNVWLTKTNSIHAAENGTYIRCEVDKGKASVSVDVDIVNPKRQQLLITNTILDQEGNKVATVTSEGVTASTSHLDVPNPSLWSVTSPSLYTCVTQIFDKAKSVLLDEYHTSFGIRTIHFDNTGFYLNGEKVQIQGVCNHHDLGCLGAAINKRALERQLQILKDAGFNGIRCSHNPPAPELLELCDEMGFLVMDESFDMWRKKKTANDYAKFFNEWHERDLHDFILRDRNHPSIVMWSIGNEVLEQWTQADADTLSLEEANLILNFGHKVDNVVEGEEMSVNSLLTKKLADYVRSLDATRPITSGCNEPSPGNHLFRSGALDIIGFNYHNQNIPEVQKNFPGKPFIITESNSALMTRGYYRQNSDSAYIWPERWDIPFADPSFSCSSYENCHVPWGNTNEENLLIMKRYPWICGQYVWTGFDYIGEPTPYGWPARSSYFGIVDLAGFPKDVYYLYQSELTDKNVLHIFPHWNFGNETFAGEGIEPSRMSEDGMVDVWAYYNNADSVELFVNGKSQGVRSKTEDLLHCVWRVKYEPGEVVAVARKNGRIVNSETIRTAGKPAQIRLTADRPVISADGTDLSFVTVEILDKDGNLCPNASNQVEFSVEGNAFIAGVDNGSPISLERFSPVTPDGIGDPSKMQRKAFYGKCLIVLQNNGATGKASLKATSKGLSPCSLDIVAY